MEVKGSVKMEIRPIGCPLQNINCIACKYLVDTYLEEDMKENKLVATILCRWGEKQKEDTKENKLVVTIPCK